MGENSGDEGGKGNEGGNREGGGDEEGAFMAISMSFSSNAMI